MHHHPWVAEPTHPSLQSPELVLSCVFYYALFAIPDYDLHNQDASPDIPSDIGPQGISYAIPSAPPYSCYDKRYPPQQIRITEVSFCRYIAAKVL
jgi:hypothetical protein